METVEFQSYVFLYTLYGGILIGIAYDIYRVLRGTRKNEHLVTSIWDFAFLAAVLLVSIWAIFSSNYGDLRAYVFIGFIVGFFLYEKILSRIAYGLFIYVKRNILFFVKTTNSVVLWPLKLLFKLIWYPVDKLYRYVRSRKLRIKKVKSLPKAVYEQNKKYFKLVIKRNKSKNKDKQ